MHVLIRGDGAAACCATHLLTNAGIRVSVEPVDRARVPAIMLSDASVALMRDVFERPQLFEAAPRIHKRVTSWGTTEPVAVEHSAIVVSEQEILSQLGAPVAYPADISGNAGIADFTIYTSRPVPDDVADKRFGSRAAQALPVLLRRDSDSGSCWIEALESGWLFLIPGSGRSGWLLGVGAPAPVLLKSSKVVAPIIASYEDSGRSFPSGPRVLASLGGPGWLACGSAAMAFDPICGDGTAHAIREAILAAAVVRAIAEGGNPASLLEHYQKRLLAGFQRHLHLCLGFYRSASQAPWWRQETQALEDGLQWCARTIDPQSGFQFQLRGFELQPVLQAGAGFVAGQ